MEGEVKNATEFGLFIGLDGDVDGMVHMSDIAWGISGEDALALHRKGEQVSAIVLDVDVEKERISLGMKQLEKGAPAAGGAAPAGVGGRGGRGGPKGGTGSVRHRGEALPVSQALSLQPDRLPGPGPGLGPAAASLGPPHLEQS